MTLLEGDTSIPSVYSKQGLIVFYKTSPYYIGIGPMQIYPIQAP